MHEIERHPAEQPFVKPRMSKGAGYDEIASAALIGKARKGSMGRLLSVFAAVGILGAATVALAAEATYRTTGKIKSVDLMRHVITLENSSTYKVARGVNIKGTKVGQKVTVITSGFGGTIEASAITPVD
jgi:hypothetical protein